MQVDWGSFPDWLSGAGSILALTFAAFAARAAWIANRYQERQVRHLVEAEDRRRDFERRAQADQFAAWIRMAPAGTPAVAVYNGSKLPIYNLILAFRLRGQDAFGRAVYSSKGPDSTATVLSFATSRLMEAAPRVLADLGDKRSWSDLYGGGHLQISARFVDIQGSTWERTVDGTLEEGPPPGPQRDQWLDEYGIPPRN